MIVGSYFVRTKKWTHERYVNIFAEFLLSHLFFCSLFFWIFVQVDVIYFSSSLSLFLLYWKCSEQQLITVSFIVAIRMAIVLCVHFSGRLSFSKLKWIHRNEKFSSLSLSYAFLSFCFYAFSVFIIQLFLFVVSSFYCCIPFGDDSKINWKWLTAF